jgi:chemotaxis protein CheD
VSPALEVIAAAERTDVAAGPEVFSAQLEGFGHIRRFYDSKRQRVAAKILPGEYYVTVTDEVITTVLGSCVSACIWDPEAGVGGMNHFTIPHASRTRDVAPGTVDEAARYGVFAMEFLINAILRNGGRRNHLLAKLVGGGHVIPSTMAIGTDNICFARTYLAEELIPLTGEHVGGDQARKVVFEARTGRAQVKEIRNGAQAAVQQEQAYVRTVGNQRRAGGVELF